MWVWVQNWVHLNNQMLSIFKRRKTPGQKPGHPNVLSPEETNKGMELHPCIHPSIHPSTYFLHKHFSYHLISYIFFDSHEIYTCQSNFISYGGFQKWWYPQNGWFIRDISYENGWWLVVPRLSGNLYMCVDLYKNGKPSLDKLEYELDKFHYFFFDKLGHKLTGNLCSLSTLNNDQLLGLEHKLGPQDLIQDETWGYLPSGKLT